MRIVSNAVEGTLRLRFLVGILVLFAFVSCDMTDPKPDNSNDNDGGPSSVQISTVAYNFQTGMLTISGSGFVATSGEANDVDVGRLGITRDGSNTAFANTSDVEIQSPSEIRITLTGADRTAVGSVIYLSELTLYAENAWNGAHSTASSGTVISVFPPPVSIHSAAYDFQTSTLTLGGSGFFATSGDTNDVDVSKLGVSTREGSDTLFTSESDVEIQSPTEISITLTGTDKAAVEDEIYRSLTLHAESTWNGAHSTRSTSTPLTISVHHPLDGQRWFQLASHDATVTDRWLPREAFASVVYDGKIIVMGGDLDYLDINAVTNDVWSSADGVTWTQVDANGAASGMNAPWSARAAHAALVHDNMIFIMGGRGSGAGIRFHDVWTSADGGASWIQVDANGGASGMNAPWSARSAHAAVVHNNKILIMGGVAASDLNDIWTSADGGASWTQVDSNGTDGDGNATMNAPWSARESHAALVHDNGTIIVMGGSFGDVWTSTDGGAMWTQVDANGGAAEGMNAPWGGRVTRASLLHNGRIFLLSGGVFSMQESDVWTSDNLGSTWTQVDANGEGTGSAAPWVKRIHHNVVIHDNKFFIMGGEIPIDSGIGYNDIWVSPVTP